MGALLKGRTECRGFWQRLWRCLSDLCVPESALPTISRRSTSFLGRDSLLQHVLVLLSLLGLRSCFALAQSQTMNKGCRCLLYHAAGSTSDGVQALVCAQLTDGVHCRVQEHKEYVAGLVAPWLDLASCWASIQVAVDQSGQKRSRLSVLHTSTSKLSCRFRC